MSRPSGDPASDGSVAALVVRRTIRADREKVFAAWIEPLQLIRWWGPSGVACTGAEFDLRVGGAYRIANLFPDGHTVWITGVFEVIERPSRLVFSWSLESQPAGRERVTVCFEPRGGSTEVIVTHERIGDATAREGHERGWVGCLLGLAQYAESP